MFALHEVQRWISWAGGLGVLVVLSVIFLGIRRGLRRPVGRMAGQSPALLRQPVFYILASLVYFGLCFLLWRPLPLALTPPVQAALLACGTLLYFPALALVLWARLALGKQYFVSTSFGAQLFTGHRLITRGPFAWVRHPMYLGIGLLGLGGIFIYQTWTFVFIALHILGLVVRARREEEALEAEFGDVWREYCRQVPAWLPRLAWWKRLNLPAGVSSLVEVGLLCLPSIPAYLWLWPNLHGGANTAFQALVYIYIITGALFIGLRRWNLAQLGLNRQGLWLSLVWGGVIIAGRTLVILAVKWDSSGPQFNWVRVLGEIVYYFCLVGFGEELFFRGLVYRALDEWAGLRGAIWGSSAGFMLWHVFGQGPLVGAATLFYGLIFALIRWRAGGIIGLILVHGLVDFTAVVLLPSLDVVGMGRPEISYPGRLVLGLALILVTPLYLWKLEPVVRQWKASVQLWRKAA